MIPSIIHKSWHPFLEKHFESDPKLLKLNTEILPYQQFYPERHNIFAVFQMPIDKIKVVLLAQDPYPNFAQANGLCFAVNEHIKMPVSLQNIVTELWDETKVDPIQQFQDPRQWKTLIHWFHQGVFLLNTALTVEAMKPGSHLEYWEDFTRTVIATIAFENSPVWLLWGAHAKKYKKTILENENFCVNDILEASHPASEYHNKGNGGFYGCNHFLKTNELLRGKGQTAINW